MTEPNSGRLSVDVVADLRKFSADLRRDVERASRNVEVKIRVKPDGRQLRRDLRDVIAAAQAKQQIKVPVEVGTGAAALRERLQATVSTASEGQKATVGTDVDGKDLPAKVRAVKTQAQRSAGSINLPVRIDAKSASGLTRTIGLLKLPALAAAVGPAVGALTALGAGLVALVAAATPAVGVLGALPGVVTPLIQGLVGVKVATKGVGDAFSQVSSAQEQLRSGQKLTEDQVNKLRAALDNISPSARRLVKVITDVRPAFTQLRRQVQEAFFAPFVNQVQRLAERYLPVLRTALTGTAGILGRTVGSFAKLAQTPLFRAQFANVLANNNRTLATLTRAVNPLARALVSLLIAADPLVQRLAGLALRAASTAERFFTAGAASGRLQDFFTKAYQAAAQLGRILQNLGAGLLNVGKAAAPLGRSLLTTLERLTRQFADFTGSAAGQNKLRAYFEATRPALTEIGRLVGAVSRAVARMGTDPSVAPLIAQLRTQLGPALDNLFQQLNGAFGPALITGLTAVVNLFATLAGAGGGGLTSFVLTLTAFVDALTVIISTVPGASTALTAFFVAAGAAKAITGVTGLVLGAGKAIFGVGQAAFGAVAGTAQFARGLLGVSGAAGSTLGVAQKAGLAIRLNLAGAFATAASGAATVGRAVLGAGSAALGAARGFSLVAAATRVWTIAQAALNIVMSLNPIVLIIIGIVALVAAIVIAYKRSEKFRAIVTAAFNGIKVAAIAVFNFFRTTVPAVFSSVVGAIETAFKFLRPIFNILFIQIRLVIFLIRTMLPVFRSVFGVIVSIVQLAFQIIRLTVLVFILAIVTVVRFQLGVMQAVFSAVWNAIVTVTRAVWGAITAVIRAAFNAIRSVVSTEIGLVRSAISAGITVIRGIISAVVNYIRGIWSAFWGSSFGGAVRAGISAVLAAVKKVIEIGKTAADAATRFVKNLVDGVAKAVKAVGQKVGDIVTTIKDFGEKMFQAGAAIIQRLIDGIKSKVDAAVGAVKALADKVGKLIPGSPVQEGPLRVLNNGYAGRQIAQMLASGIDSGQGQIAAAAGRLASSFTFPAVPALAGGTGPAGIPLTAAPAAAAATGGGRVTNLTITAAPDVPTAQQLLRVLSYAEALHA